MSNILQSNTEKCTFNVILKARRTDLKELKEISVTRIHFADGYIGTQNLPSNTRQDPDRASWDNSCQIIN